MTSAFSWQNSTPFKVIIKYQLQFLCCTIYPVAYFIRNSLHLLISYPCIIPLPFPLPFGNHQAVLYNCESVSFQLYSLAHCNFQIPPISNITVFSLSYLFHLAQYPPSPSMLMQKEKFSFFFMACQHFTVCVCVCVCVCVYTGLLLYLFIC